MLLPKAGDQHAVTGSAASPRCPMLVTLLWHADPNAVAADTVAAAFQVAAAGAACNLLLGFSTVRKALINAGALQALVPLTSSMLPELRQNAVWALKNLAHECSAEDLTALLAELPWSGFRVLLVGDDDARVQEQAVGLLQNLCRGGGPSISQVRQ